MVGGGGAGTGNTCSKLCERTKSALFVMISALFVETNATVNINLTSKLPFVFLKHLRMPCMSLIVFLTSKTPQIYVPNILQFAQQQDF